MQHNPLLFTSQLTDADMQAIEQNLADIDNILAGKVPELTPEQRRNLGAVDEQNKLIINKVLSSLDSHPQIQPEGINWQRFRQEAVLRELIEGRILQLKAQLHTLESAKILHDNNNLQASLGYYRFLDYLSSVKQGDVSVLNHEFKALFKKYGIGSARAAKKRAEKRAKDKDASADL
jgi:hypothetical protein